MGLGTGTCSITCTIGSVPAWHQRRSVPWGGGPLQAEGCRVTDVTPVVNSHLSIPGTWLLCPVSPHEAQVSPCSPVVCCGGARPRTTPLERTAKLESCWVGVEQDPMMIGSSASTVAHSMCGAAEPWDHWGATLSPQPAARSPPKRCSRSHRVCLPWAIFSQHLVPTMSLP